MTENNAKEQSEVERIQAALERIYAEHFSGPEGRVRLQKLIEQTRPDPRDVRDRLTTAFQLGAIPGAGKTPHLELMQLIDEIMAPPGKMFDSRGNEVRLTPNPPLLSLGALLLGDPAGYQGFADDGSRKNKNTKNRPRP